MDMNRSLKALHEMFKDQEWFFDVGTDESNRLVVYVNYMCPATLYDIPANIDGHQILVHLAVSKTATREQYTSPDYDKRKLELVDEDEFSYYHCKNSVEEVGRELDRLEKICGSNILQDIFYECHDGKNAVTNLSARYPEVRDRLSRLYDQYGFDIVYEELDG